MAILKHIPSCNAKYSDALDYLTKQHDEETGKPILDELGRMIDREEFLIEGINCEPETFAEKCFFDSQRFYANRDPRDVKTHQYVISFDPRDKEKGLTLEAAMKEGLRFARKNFPGHRVLVAAHPDGDNESGNIHVHIIISSLRFEDREPNPECMKLNKDGSVKASEYKAGCKHQQTAKLRKYLFDQVQDYCRENGYTVCESKSKKKVTDKEYKAQKSGQEKLDHDNEARRQKGQKVVQTNFVSKKDELRMAIDDALANTNNWDDFTARLRTHYTRQVEINPRNPKIPYLQKKEMWDEYKACNEGFWSWYKVKNGEISEPLSDAYSRIKKQSELSWKVRNRKNYFGTRVIALIKLNQDGGDQREGIRAIIASLRERQEKLRLYKETYKTYADAAALALKNNLETEARFCLDQMKELRSLQKGVWKDGFLPDTQAQSFVGGKVKSRVTWMNTKESDLSYAKKTMKRVKEKVRYVEGVAAHPQYREEAFPIDVKITRGVISFKHPDYENWTRGKTLGTQYEIEALSQKMEQNRSKEDLLQKKQEEYYRLKQQEKEEEKERQITAQEKARREETWQKIGDHWEEYVVPSGTYSIEESLEYWRIHDRYMYEDQMQAHIEFMAWADEVGGMDHVLVEMLTEQGLPENEILYELERQYPDSDLIMQLKQQPGSLEHIIASADKTKQEQQNQSGWTGADDNDGGFAGER